MIPPAHLLYIAWLGYVVLFVYAVLITWLYLRARDMQSFQENRGDQLQANVTALRRQLNDNVAVFERQLKKAEAEKARLMDAIAELKDRDTLPDAARAINNSIDEELSKPTPGKLRK